MTSLTQLRRQFNRRVQMLLGRPTNPQLFKAQTKQLSFAEVQAMPELPSDEIQNPDGTFQFMMGYDGLGEAPLA